jgi:alpha-beta hydrolase superfamily lysophospholipase
MKHRTLSILKKTLITLLIAACGGLVTLILIAVLFLESRPDLKAWHRVHLDAEYTKSSPATDLSAYLELEARLFEQLEREVYDRIPAEERGPIKRYHRGSLSDPARWERNWNRTFELGVDTPAAGVLLLHGMSDSPYSLRALGLRLNKKGAHVLGLRLPGHGTAPSGLVDLQWEDMAAAVRLAIRHLKDRVGDAQILLVGYSTGGALAVHYALEALGDNALPSVGKVVLISPAIGVTPLAELSVWQARLGRWLGLPKLAWNSIQPEYNPFKYSSFAINAGDQVYRLTKEIRARLNAAQASGDLGRLPPILTFQSVVDATVSTPAVVTGLYSSLRGVDDALVVFDINRHADVTGLLAGDPLNHIQALVNGVEHPFDYCLVTNENETSSHVMAYRSHGIKPAEPLALQWPQGIHSLSHVALPFPMDDPLYGVSDEVTPPGIALSKITLRGERGVVNIPAEEMLRLKWNPFYPYLEQRVMSFLDLQEDR